MILPDLPGFIVLAPLLLITLLGAFWQMRKHEQSLQKQKKEINQRIYEILVLREIGERIGYQLDISKILDTIITSVNNLVPFTAVSYMLVTPNGEAVDFKVHLTEMVNEKFLEGLRGQLLDSLNKISPKKYDINNLHLSVTGAIIDEHAVSPLNSSWLIPLSINNHGLGVLAIASKTPGLYRGPEMEILVKIIAQASRAVNNLEKVITASQEKINSMVTSMPDGVLMFGKDLELLVINPAAQALLGLPTQTKTTIFDVARSLAEKIDLRAKIDESNSVKKLVVVDNLLLSGKYSRLLISPVFDHQQNLVGNIVVFHDQTAEKQLEQIRDDYIAMMVHELRAPLTVVRGATDMFLRSPNMSSLPEGQALLKTMQESATSMLSLVNDFLDLAKIEAGKFQILKTTNNLSEIITDQITFFSQLANQKSINLTSDVSDPALIVQLDRDRIAQVFSNLLSNAIKFTPLGGKITVSAVKINSSEDIKWRFHSPYNFKNISFPCVLISVADTGRGISPDKVSQLFSKFRQITLESSQRGTGLGLVIAKGIIESHGGQIFLESRVDEGTTFYFTLDI